MSDAGSGSRTVQSKSGHVEAGRSRAGEGQGRAGVSGYVGAVLSTAGQGTEQGRGQSRAGLGQAEEYRAAEGAGQAAGQARARRMTGMAVQGNITQGRASGRAEQGAVQGLTLPTAAATGLLLSTPL